MYMCTCIYIYSIYTVYIPNKDDDMDDGYNHNLDELQKDRTLQLVFKDQSGRHHWKMGNPHN